MDTVSEANKLRQHAADLQKRIEGGENLQTEFYHVAKSLAILDNINDFSRSQQTARQPE
ncbi:hypothetical protein [Rhizobium lusitanum]|uniref:Uncharacterized protein n=1 Tax=Rhizobium lusitanum TaxID=293958 RepID=A0A1C3USX8_9HYPH|nr:hypothetical protein [Rhizobium lusitanum]SCB18603.1 hypothetical protein GA0061101_103284 [Rhizobium lusitanum]